MWLDHDGWTTGFYDPSTDNTRPKTDAEAIAEIGGPFKPQTCSVDLQFSGHLCDPEALKSAMGGGLAKGWKKGDRVSRKGSLLGLLEKTGFCTFDSYLFGNFSSIDEHLALLLVHIEQNFEELSHLIARDGLTSSPVWYFEDLADAAAWQPSPENTARAARLGIPIRIVDILSQAPAADPAKQPARYLET